MMPAPLPDPAPRKYLRPWPTPDLPPLRATRVLDQLRERLRLMYYSLRTEETCANWVKAFIRFHSLRHVAEMGGPEVEAFLTHLADDRSVAPSTHSQALSVLLFSYTKVLRHDLPWQQEIGHPRCHRCVDPLLVVIRRDAVVGELPQSA